MRTHPNTELRFPEYTNLTTSAKNRLRREVNRDSAGREHQMEVKGCFTWGERGINLTDLPAGSQIPSMIARQGWEYFVRTPEPYDDHIVRLFYRNMIPAVYNDKYTVMIGSIQVRISLEDITEYHRVPRRAELGMNYGLSRSEEFRVNQNPVIARALRRSGEAGWNRERDEIKKGDMHIDIAFLLLWIRTSLIPSTHNTVADPRTAHILYSLQRGYPIGAAHLMWMEILDAGMSLDGALPFPSMITYFCRQKQLEIGALTNPKPNWGKRNYKTLVTWANKKDRERQAEVMQEDPNYDEDQYNEVDPEFVADDEEDEGAEEESDDEEEEHTGTTPPYMTRMNNQWNRRLTRMESRWENELSDINWRLDRMGAPSASERRNVRKRSDGGASSSRHG